MSFIVMHVSDTKIHVVFHQPVFMMIVLSRRLLKMVPYV